MQQHTLSAQNAIVKRFYHRKRNYLLCLNGGILVATLMERVQTVVADKLGVEESEVSPDKSFMDDLNNSFLIFLRLSHKKIPATAITGSRITPTICNSK